MNDFTQKPKIAVIGCGYWGINLVRNFHDLGVLSVVCDPNQSSLKRIRGLYPELEQTDDYRTILPRSDISGVVIATPAITHFDIAQHFLLAGKDVFVEKPLALKHDDGINLINTASKNKRILMVGHVLEYHPAIIMTREMVSDGALGDLHYIYSNRLNFGKVRSEENILWSFAPHDIAITLRIVGAMPNSVSAFSAEYVTPSIPDVTITNLSFDNSIKGHIHVSWLHPFKEQRLVVIGSKGMLTFDDVNKKLLLYDQHLEIKNTTITPVTKNVDKIPYDTQEPLRLECEAFIESITTRKEPLTNGASGLRVLEVLESAQKSINNNGISIPTGKAYIE